MTDQFVTHIGSFVKSMAPAMKPKVIAEPHLDGTYAYWLPEPTRLFTEDGEFLMGEDRRPQLVVAPKYESLAQQIVDEMWGES